MLVWIYVFGYNNRRCIDLTLIDIPDDKVVELLGLVCKLDLIQSAICVKVINRRQSYYVKGQA